MTDPSRPTPPAAPGRPSADDGRRPEDPAVTREVARSTGRLGLWLLGAVAATFLPLPLSLVGVLLAVGAVVVGVRGLVVAARARARGAAVPVMATGITLALLVGAAQLAPLAAWDASLQLQECRRVALTTSAKARCEEQFREALEERREQLTERQRSLLERLRSSSDR